MTKPFLIVITGRPASGKTTLGHLLSQEINCPLLSRDEIKEGYINTVNTHHKDLDNSIAWHIYNTFFAAIELFISRGISIIAEAAFQDKLWKPKLLDLASKTEIKIIICTTNSDIGKERFSNRIINNPNRKKYHGDKQTDLFDSPYEPVNMNIPTLQVDTTEGYKPDLQKIMRFIKTISRAH